MPLPTLFLRQEFGRQGEAEGDFHACADTIDEPGQYEDGDVIRECADGVHYGGERQGDRKHDLLVVIVQRRAGLLGAPTTAEMEKALVTSPMITGDAPRKFEYLGSAEPIIYCPAELNRFTVSMMMNAGFQMEEVLRSDNMKHTCAAKNLAKSDLI